MEVGPVQRVVRVEPIVDPVPRSTRGESRPEPGSAGEISVSEAVEFEVSPSNASVRANALAPEEPDA